MTRLALAVLLLAAVPGLAEACASCLTSAYGDRTFNLAFLGLLAMPFVVAALIGGVLLYAHRRRPDARPWDHPIKETT